MINIDANEIHELFVQDYTANEIAKKYGVTHKVIKRIAIDNGMEEFVTRKPLDLTLDDVYKLVDDGYLLQDIARMYRVNRGTIRAYFTSIGVPKDLFCNNKNQRKKQSEFMKEHNPVTCGRPEYIHKAMINGYKRKCNDDRQRKLQNGITYKEYCSYAHYDAYIQLCGQYDSSTQAIDHMYSVKDCWDNKIPLEYVSNINNLRIIPIEDNLKKSSSSCITLNEFMNNIGVQRLSKAQLNWKRVE